MRLDFPLVVIMQNCKGLVSCLSLFSHADHGDLRETRSHSHQGVVLGIWRPQKA